jgi:tetratricopeptide (TPR) repeat protein
MEVRSVLMVDYVVDVSEMEAIRSQGIPEETLYLASFIEAPCMVVKGQIVPRQVLIEYVVNKLGGAHFDPQRAVSAKDKLFLLLDLVDRQILVADKNAIYYELLSTGQALTKADDISFFLDVESKLMRNLETVQAHLDRGVELAKLGQYEDALVEFGEVTKADLGHVQAYNNTGLALLHLGRLAEAEESLRRAIGLDKKYPDAHYNIACVHSRQGNLSKCIEELEKVKQLDGFVGGIDPISDPDFANILHDRDYGPRFRALVARERDEA